MPRIRLQQESRQSQPQPGFYDARLISRKDGEWVAARSASDDDLKVRLLAHATCIARARLEAAEPTSRRYRSLAGRLFIHAEALYAGLAVRPAESTGNACSALVYWESVDSSLPASSP